METAVEWYNIRVIELMSQREQGNIDVLEFRNRLDLLFEQAKEMEKEQNKLQPIPLTEEWLLKFGFNKEPDKSFTKRDIAIFLDKRFSSNLFMQENQGDFTWFSYECKIEYVHQVQNLYFALTGEELILKSE